MSRVSHNKGSRAMTKVSDRRKGPKRPPPSAKTPVGMTQKQIQSIKDAMRRDPSYVLQMSERDFQATVCGISQLYNFEYGHLSDARAYTMAGVPDLWFRHRMNGKMFWVELKTEKGEVSEIQRRFINDMLKNNLEVFIWRPRLLVAGEIERVFQSCVLDGAGVHIPKVV